jgi:ParB family chromosome partitioning protein
VKRLGRGLGSLLSEPEGDLEPREVSIKAVRPNPHQPRKTFDPEALTELSDSIKTHGVLQPIVVRRGKEGFELIAGERRWRASQQAGLEKIPAVVRDEVADETMLELALVENVQREDLDPIEKAQGYKSMIERLGLTQEETATRVGIRRPTVANHLRLLELPPPVQEMVRTKLLSMGHARALLAIDDPVKLQKLAEAAVRHSFSVREVERIAKDDKAKKKGRKAAVATQDPKSPWAEAMESRLRESLGTKVRVENGAGYRGRIIVEYFGREELERLYALLAPKATL